jgi:hypothetical protein
MVVYEYDYPGGITMNNVKFRAFVWIVSEIFLVFAIALNHLPRKSSLFNSLHTNVTKSVFR